MNGSSKYSLGATAGLYGFPLKPPGEESISSVEKNTTRQLKKYTKIKFNVKAAEIDCQVDRLTVTAELRLIRLSIEVETFHFLFGGSSQ